MSLRALAAAAVLAGTLTLTLALHPGWPDSACTGLSGGDPLHRFLGCTRRYRVGIGDE